MATTKKSGNALYHPSEGVKMRARVKEYDKLYQESITDREGFWAKEAEELFWYQKWNKVLDDSKKLSAKKRQALRPVIEQEALYGFFIRRTTPMASSRQ